MCRRRGQSSRQSVTSSEASSEICGGADVESVGSSTRFLLRLADVEGTARVWDEVASKVGEEGEEGDGLLYEEPACCVSPGSK